MRVFCVLNQDVWDNYYAVSEPSEDTIYPYAASE